MSITPAAPPSVTRTGMLINYGAPISGEDRAEWLREGGHSQGVDSVEGGGGREMQKAKKPADACAYLPARPAALPVFSMFSRSKCLVPHRGAARAVARAPPDRCCQWETPIYPAERPRPEPQLFCVLSVSVDCLGEGSVFISGISRAYLQFPRENNHPM